MTIMFVASSVIGRASVSPLLHRTVPNRPVQGLDPEIWIDADISNVLHSEGTSLSVRGLSCTARALIMSTTSYQWHWTSHSTKLGRLSATYIIEQRFLDPLALETWNRLARVADIRASTS